MLPSILVLFYPFTASAARFMGVIADNSTIVIDKVALADAVPLQYAADIPLFSLNPTPTAPLFLQMGNVPVLLRATQKPSALY